MSFDLIELRPPPEPIVYAGARPYQREMITSTNEGWTDDGCQSQLLCAATGTGKTFVMGGIAKTFADSGGRVLGLAHTNELVDQGRNSMQRFTGIRTGKEKAEERALLSDKIVMGSVQTMRGPNRLRSFPKNHFDAILIDEAHRTPAKGYLDVLDYFDCARYIGFTATADRGDKKELGKYYQRLAYDYPMPKAVEDGWLVRPMVETLPLKIDLNPRSKENKVVRRNTDGETDLDMAEVSHRIEPFIGELAREIHRKAANRRILGFAPSVDIAQKMVLACKAAGFTSVDWVAGEDRQRTEKIAAYKRGQIQVLWNAMLLTEGFDHDAIDCLVPLRPTMVRGLYVQMVGRGTRPLTSIVPALNAAGSSEERRAIIAASAKPEVLLLDPLWLYEQHDLCAPASLVCKSEEEAKFIKGKQGDLLKIAETATRDMLEALRKQLLANVNKKAARVDPFTFGVVVGDEELANYQPVTLWDAREPTIEQMRALVEHGIKIEDVKWRGQAQMCLKVVEDRRDRGLCSVRLMNWLRGRKINAALMTQEEAIKQQRRFFARH